MENIIYKILYIIIYSFLGWICEVIYCYILDHKFTNRGFLNGPLCPVYGFGALFVLTFLNDFRNNVFLVFILGVIITSVLEYVTSVILEVLFHTKWWDYSNHKFNIHGRVCLLNSILFGILSVVLVEVINPAIVNLVSKFPKELVILITILLTTAIFVDFVITVSTMLKLNSKLHNLNGLANEFEELGISFIEKTEKDLDLAISKLNKGKNKEEILNRVRSLRKDGLVQRRILKAFPTMKHKKYDNLLQGLKKFNK